MDWANVSIFDLLAYSSFFFFYFSAYSFYFYSYFSLVLDLDLDFFNGWAYYSDYSYFLWLEPLSSNRKPRASVGLTLEGGNSHIYVLFLISISTPFPILLSLIYVPLVLRSVNIILSSFFSIWQCFELSLLSLIGTSQEGTLPITMTGLSNSYAANPVESGTILPQTALKLKSTVFSRLIYWDIL